MKLGVSDYLHNQIKQTIAKTRREEGEQDAGQPGNSKQGSSRYGDGKAGNYSSQNFDPDSALAWASQIHKQPKYHSSR